jgi:DNA replication protein DnaC
MNTLLNELKENFHKDKEDLDDYDIWYNDLVNCDLLIIDDAFDKKSLVYKSGYQITYLDTLLRTRLERTGKSIIFTSNTNIEDIDEEKFSLSIKELVKRNTLNCVFEMKDKVDRLQKDFNVDDLWS